MVTTSFSSIILLIIADQAQSMESMEEESQAPENIYTVLGENARGNTGKQSGGERVGLGWVVYRKQKQKVRRYLNKEQRPLCIHFPT